MADPLSRLNTNPVDVGNILRNVEALKTSKLNRETGRENLLSARAKRQEFEATSDYRQFDRELSQTIKELQLDSAQADLMKRTADAMTNELVTITPEQYSAFLQKWKDNGGIDTSGFPPPGTFQNNPQAFEAFQMQAVRTADVVKLELIEKIKQKGQTERKQLDFDAALVKATSVEEIKQRGQTTRQMLKEQGVGDIKPNGDLTNFMVIKGRKPSSTKEFADFRKAISNDSGLTDKLKEIKTDYFSTIGRANSASMGVGQYVADPNKEQVAKQEYDRAEQLKQEFIAAGGNSARLGAGPQTEPDTITVDVQKGDAYFNPDTKERMIWDEKQQKFVVDK